jgi:sporadic carbohydrate cluster protein (TIGR04323 family)
MGQGYRGYVSCREFGGMRIPVSVQSLVLRDYCARNRLHYKLHVNENSFPHSYLVLEGLTSNLEGLAGVLMCSMFMLPERRLRRDSLYQRFLRQNTELHFVLEGYVIRTPEDVEKVEEIFQIQATLDECPTAEELSQIVL